MGFARAMLIVQLGLLLGAGPIAPMSAQSGWAAMGASADPSPAPTDTVQAAPTPVAPTNGVPERPSPADTPSAKATPGLGGSTALAGSGADV